MMISNETPPLETLLKSVSQAISDPSPENIDKMHEHYNAYLLSTARVHYSTIQFAAQPVKGDLVSLIADNLGYVKIHIAKDDKDGGE